MTDQYQDWRSRLAGVDVPIIEDQPQSGFYEYRNKYGARKPVCIWRTSEGKLNCRVGKEAADAMQIWTWVAKRPIEKDLAVHAFETGTWPDEPAPIAKAEIGHNEPAPIAKAEIGHNEPAPIAKAEIGHNEPDNPYEALMAEVHDRIEQASELIKNNPDGASDKMGADLARNLEQGIQALIKRGNEMHQIEKEPHLAAGREVDAKFRWRQVLEKLKRDVKTVWGKFAAKEEARLQAEAAAEATRAEEEHARLQREDPLQAILEEPAQAPKPVKVQTGGAVGTRGGLTDKWCHEIEDIKQCAMFFAEHPDIRKALDKVTANFVRVQKDNAVDHIPGVKVWKERVAR